jgi:hypothetical protein
VSYSELREGRARDFHTARQDEPKSAENVTSHGREPELKSEFVLVDPAGIRLPSQESMSMTQTSERSDCLERRCGQRFSLHVPVSVRLCGSPHESGGFTQDLSSRGSFFFTDFPLAVGERIEVTLRMPSEITLGDSMRVRCQARVLRVVQPTAGTRLGVAVCFAGYEYLQDQPDDAGTQAFDRISALHGHSEEEPAEADHHSRPVS